MLYCDTDSLPYKDIKVTDASVRLFLDTYKDEPFFRFLLAINISERCNGPQFCLSTYGKNLFSNDTILSLEKSTLEAIKDRLPIEIHLNEEEIVLLEEQIKAAEFYGNVDKIEKLKKKIDARRKKQFPTESMKKEISRQERAVLKAYQNREDTIKTIVKRMHIVEAVENGKKQYR